MADQLKDSTEKAKHRSNQSEIVVVVSHSLERARENGEDKSQLAVNTAEEEKKIEEKRRDEFARLICRH